MLKIRIPATSESIVDYNARIVVPWQTGMAADFADIRFYEADQTTALAQYRQTYVSGDSAIWWVKIPNKTAYIYDIYMQFGVATELLSDGDATFLFFDSGETALDLTKWDMTLVNSWTVYDGCYRWNASSTLRYQSKPGGSTLPYVPEGQSAIAIAKKDGRIIIDPVNLTFDAAYTEFVNGEVFHVGETYTISIYETGDDFTNIGASENVDHYNVLSGALDGIDSCTWYTISSYVEGDDFTNVSGLNAEDVNKTGAQFVSLGGYPSNWTNGSVLIHHGLDFVATGSTPTDWTHGSSVRTHGTKYGGYLMEGSQYKIVDYHTGDDFTNVGAASNANGVIFTATGRYPTVWSNSSLLTTTGWNGGPVSAREVMTEWSWGVCELTKQESKLTITVATNYTGTGDVGLCIVSPNLVEDTSELEMKWGSLVNYGPDALPVFDGITDTGDPPSLDVYMQGTTDYMTQAGPIWWGIYTTTAGYWDLVVVPNQIPAYRFMSESIRVGNDTIYMTGPTFFTRLYWNDDPQVDDDYIAGYDFAEWRRIYHRPYGAKGFLWKAVGTNTAITKSAFISPINDYPEGDPFYRGDINNGDMQLSFEIKSYNPSTSFKDIFMYRTGAPVSPGWATPTADPLAPVIDSGDVDPPIVYNNYFIISERCRVLLAGLRDFTIEQGTVFDRTVVWYDENNALVDLTTYSARLSLRKNKDDVSPVFVFTSETPAATEGSITLGGTAGTIRLLADATLTRALDFDRAFYDLEVSPSGVADFTVSTDNIRVLEGVFILSREATKE